MICFAGNLGDPTGESAHRIFDPEIDFHNKMIAEFQRTVKLDNYLSGRYSKARLGNSWALGAAPPARPYGLERGMCARRVKMPFLLIFCAIL